MTPWYALWTASKPLLGWIIAAVLAVIVAGVWVGYSAGHDAAKMRCETARADSERKARDWYEAQIAERDARAAHERQRAETFRLRMERARERAAQEREDLQHALTASDLRVCDASGPWRVLARKRARINRDHAEAITGTGQPHDRSGLAAALSGRHEGPLPRTCEASFKYNEIMMDAWDRLADQCRQLQQVVRERQ